MDIKSKKYDRLWIIKLICLIISLIFVSSGTFKLYSFYSEQTNRYNKSFDYNTAVNITKSVLNENYNSMKSSSFLSLCRTFSNLATKSATIYHSKSKADYNLYKNEYRNTYKTNLENVLLWESASNEPYFTFYCLENGYISLERLSDKEVEATDCSFYYADETGYVYIVDTIDDISGNEQATRVESEIAEQITASSLKKEYIDKEISFYSANQNVTESIAYAHYEQGVFGSVKFGEEKPSTLLLNKADEDNADLVISIENSYYGENREYYNGWYEVKINTKKLTPSDSFGTFYQYNSVYFGSFEDYKSQVSDNREALEKYKNIYFAVYDKTNKRLVSTTFPGTDLSSQINDIRAKAEGYTYSFTYYPDGSDIQSNFEQAIYSGIQGDIKDLLSNNNYEYYAAFDTDFTGGSDVLSEIYFDSSEIRAAFFTEYFNHFVICLAGTILCFLVIIALSGRKSYDKEIHLAFGDKIPTEIRLILFAVIALLYYHIFGYVLFNGGFGSSRYIIVLDILVCSYILLIFDIILFFVRNIKKGILFKNLIITRLFKLLKRLVVSIRTALSSYIKSRENYNGFLKDVVRIVLLFLIVPNLIMLYIIGASLNSINEISLFFSLAVTVYDIGFIVYAIKQAYHLKEIFATLHNIKNGDYSVKIDSGSLPSYAKAYADDLNSVSDGIKINIEKAVREERTKSELITNVSHDLKTPLTSIINYVDLLKKCPIQDETAREYLEILGTKSEKLKKLIEDLIEASKASTGAIEANLIKINLNELLYQIVGEYEDELSKKNIQVIINHETEDYVLFADSKLAYRVLDNLFINIKKYAMANSRVYIDKTKMQDKICVRISNYSDKQLNINPEELMERFVRGDESRNTDGNGLGLSIAKNLMKIQNGLLEIEIDGDLFITRLFFNEA